MKSEDRNHDGECLRELAAFLPKFEAPGFEFGRWDPTLSEEPVRRMPFFDLTPVASDFVVACRVVA